MNSYNTKLKVLNELLLKKAYAQQANTFPNQSTQLAPQSPGLLSRGTDFAANTLDAYNAVDDIAQLPGQVSTLNNLRTGASLAAPAATGLARFAGPVGAGISAGMYGYGAYDAQKQMNQTQKAWGNNDLYKQTAGYKRLQSDRNANALGLGAIGAGALAGAALTSWTGPGALVGATVGAGVAGVGMLGRSAYNWGSKKITGTDSNLQEQATTTALGKDTPDMNEYGAGLLNNYYSPDQYKSKNLFGKSVDNAKESQDLLVKDVQKQMLNK